MFDPFTTCNSKDHQEDEMVKRNAPVTTITRSSKRLKVTQESVVHDHNPGDTKIHLPQDEEDKILAKKSDGKLLMIKEEASPGKQEAPSENVHSDIEDESEDVSAYEKKRLQNIQDNKTFLLELGIFQAKEELQTLSTKKKKSTGIFTKKKKPELIPCRVSLRIANKAPEGIQLPSKPEPTYGNYHFQPRKPSGLITMSDALKFDSEDNGAAYLSHMQTIARSDSSAKSISTSTSYDSIVKSMKKMKINEKQVTKVVSSRIFSVAIHPSQTKVLAVAGDKGGQIGFWDVESTDEKNNGVCIYEPHSRPVTCLKFGINDPQRVFSSSYDGTVRCCHIENGVFNEVFRTSDEYEERCLAFDFVDRHSLAVGIEDGSLVIQDTRTLPGASISYDVQDSPIKCVSVHPMKSCYICTSSRNGNAYLWDTRNIKNKNPKPLLTFPCGRAVSSAHFSPVTGQSLLITSLDDRLRVADTSNMEEVKLRGSIRHDNHTGRWLTPFRAEWHPMRDDLFVVGSMARPRQIDIYNDKCEVVKTFQDPENLASVSSINALHPSRNILVGGNASGKLFVFM
ncbi:WD repeat-containing protein 76-like [Lineus longissimus]|uniref:WD repeat-containing protein 76-like n=1 Tax=Lineus longissimus TaxID=88925 RepID=UPI002B4EF97A